MDRQRNEWMDGGRKGKKERKGKKGKEYFLRSKKKGD